MNPPSASSRHRIWPWLLGLALTPFVAFAVLAARVVRLNADASALRSEITHASGARWRTTVQFSVPRAGVSAARAITSLINDVPPEAREALGAVRSASVGVYECTPGQASSGLPVAAIDAVMVGRGWSRLAGVVDGCDTVLVYLSPARGSAVPSSACVAVRSGTQLVVVAADFNADALARLASRQLARHAGEFHL